MPNISFSTFGAKPIALTGTDAQVVKDKLSENLKTFIINKAPQAERALLDEKLKTVAINMDTVKEKSLSEMIDSVLLPQFSTDNQVKEILTGLSKSPGSIKTTVADVTGFDLPLKDNPLLKDEYFKAKTSAYGTLSGLPATAIDKLTEKSIDIDDMDDQSLKKLVDDHVITAAQNTSLKLTIDISRLSGENLDLIKAVHDDNSTIESLIDYNPADWKKLLTAKNIPIPYNEKSTDTYAQNLAKNMEMSFPQTFFLNRVILKKNFSEPLTTFDAITAISRLGNIEYKSGNILLDNIKWTGIGETEKNSLIDQVKQLQDFSNTYKYLDVTGVLAKEGLDITAKKEIVSKRLDQLKVFYTKNNKLDFASLDFFDSMTSHDYSGVDEANKPLIKAQAMAYQRMLIVGANANTAQVLLAKGFSSSRDIVHAGENGFTEVSGLALNEAKAVFNKALDNVTATSHFLQAIRDTQKGGFNSLTVNNLRVVVNDLRQIDGYDRLFGNQDFCECDHCRSIFSPAAYFTDLMLFVERNVTQKVFTGSNSQHPINLKSRRPDLWTVPLTCQNTTTEIPYLDVVNDVLEQYIHTLPEIGTKDAYGVLSKWDLSFNLPFNLPLEQLRTYLGHFDLFLSDVYKALNADIDLQGQERMGLSAEELTIITTADPEKASQRLGSPDLNSLQVSEFIRLVNISRSELDELLAIQSIPEISKAQIEVTEIAGDIQQYEEKFIAGTLTKERLDIIQRFLKIWEKSPWTIHEFDWGLHALSNAGSPVNFEDKHEILSLADVIAIQKRLKLNIEELVSIIDMIPEVPFDADKKGFFERLFNLGDIFVNNTEIIVSGANLSHLLAGLSITEHELNLLLPLIGVATTATVSVTKQNLSQLYRQCRLASGLRLSIEEFISAVNVVLQTGEVKTLAQVTQLIENKNWIDTTPFNFQQVDCIISGNVNKDNKYVFPLEKLGQIVDGIKTSSEDANVRVATLKNKIPQVFNINQVQLAADYSVFVKTIDPQFISDILSAGLTDANPLLKLLNDAGRKIFCFDKLKWDGTDISFFGMQHTKFGVDDVTNWSLENLKTMSVYTDLITGLPVDSKDEMRKILEERNIIHDLDQGDVESISSIWSYASSIIKGVIAQLPADGFLIADLNRVKELSALCSGLGLQPDTLNNLLKTDFVGLQESADLVYGAFASKYPDEKVRTEKLEAYHDRINTLKRDALCDFIISNSQELKFKDRSDLYYFFLLDVEMSGCFRTTKLLAAISSVQLYIHRCLMNLEQSDTGNLAVKAAMIPADEWEWMKNYRVWEANRKVFLYPENYIDPALRNTKTPLFKELEDELLQQNINMDTAEAAYTKYLAQFLNLSHLRYAGAYYNYVQQSATLQIAEPANTINNNNNIARRIVALDFQLATFADPFIDKDKTEYYFFARTYLQPFEFYYRTFNSYKGLWGHWEKIDVPIEAEEISVIIHNGKLHIYWSEVQYQEVTDIKGGTPTSDNVTFKVTTKYSHLEANGKWSSPQRLYLGKATVSVQNIKARIGGITDEIYQNDKDAVIEKYKSEVFRKPYVFKKENESGSAIPEELIINHIYTAEIFDIQSVSYKTIERKIYDDLTFPPFYFVVKNGRFNEVDSQTIPIGPYETTVKIMSANQAYVSVNRIYNDSGGMPWIYSDNWNLTVEFDAQPVKTVITSYTQNLYKYTKDPNRFFDKDPLDIQVGEIFGKEFLTAYRDIDEGVYEHFVDDSTKDFEAGNKIVTQFKQGDAHLIFPGNNGLPPVMKQLSTILSDELNIILLEKGLSDFLSLQTQNIPNSAGQLLDFNGAYGAYYWEMFFHIPFLIASHLNANQDFKGAKWWYERIFNPTSPELTAPGNPGEHNWQFREFRGLDITKLKDILSDESCIAIYKKDPFDPHAIASLRISAYQKAIVMNYIDNLLDWGDSLFAQDTQESIVEADMLYQLAQDILGKRPVKTGKCKTEDEDEITYQSVISAIDHGSEFLINLENVYETVRNRNSNDKAVLENSKYLSKVLENMGYDDATPNTLNSVANLATARYFSDLNINSSATATFVKKPEVIKYAYIKGLTYQPLVFVGKPYTDLNDPKNKLVVKPGKNVPATDVADQSHLAFCVPVNEELLQYWDRVEDRLFKIRNCMNISGIRRSLALFQPPINPMLLVRAKALGISLDEISSIIETTKLPNYRFVFMIEKAKQFTQNVQGFGAALLSALEKKDGEELTLLRSVHESNILQLTKEIKKRQLEEAQKQYAALEETITNIENRTDYYQGLIDEGLTGWEITEQVSKKTALGIRTSEATLGFLASTFALLPEIGNPFAMKYGGVALSGHQKNFTDSMGTLAAIADNIAILAAIEGSNQRRSQEWNFQLNTAKQELKQTTQQLLAADLRIKIAERDQEIHEKTLDQSNEVHDFLQNKFTSLGLYNYMASSLNRLYRMSYGMALDMAKSAQECYATELGDTDTIFIQSDNWQNDRAGLLAGERLMLQLNQMEQSYLNGYKRCPEITQNFSLALLSPDELIKLKQTGKCTIIIPEIAFDILYPGQFRRFIKGVKITIPCITGPYTNISANLKLTQSALRINEEDVALTVNTPTENISISTSSATNDSGTFEFNFRDERYLPFEYAGAISEWELNLPSKIRSFNYNSISDVILHMSYTAQEGNREEGEAKVLETFDKYVRDNGLFKVISLKYEFPDEFYNLLSNDNQTIEFDLTNDYFPYFLIDKELSLDKVTIYLKPKRNMAVTIPTSMKINEVNAVSWNIAEDIPVGGSENDKIKAGTVSISGSPIQKWQIDAGLNGIDRNSIEDLLILIKYSI